MKFTCTRENLSHALDGVSGVANRQSHLPILSNIFIAFHYALIVYVNSTFLSNFFSETQVSSLYIIGSIVNTILLLLASRILEKLGIYRFAVSCIVIEFLAVLGLAVFDSSFFIGLFFLTHLVTISLLLFNMDMFIEDVSVDYKSSPITSVALKE